ncbi:hypothetical protein [Branchiibius sp. NY16-3462-2]|uniref:hypothetical protein n=1 Tax=Branchiibius sp. NY16-3462-2 TaxID=1807500 RepID=UPI00079ABBFF|nr:hypothetical protein [Branchiibius sp. NY16-3462-2]KYH43878.1 hypothetical protein AZH51_15710 [Branchiibius sp. NY16-3462-2]
MAATALLAACSGSGEPAARTTSNATVPSSASSVASPAVTATGATLPSTSATSSSPSASTSTAAPSQTETETDPDYPPPESASQVPPPPQATTALVSKFVTVLGHTAGVGRTAWTDALTPLCSTEFGNQLALGSPDEIPDQTVTGAPRLVGTNPLLDAAFFVPTSKGGFTVWVDYSTAPGKVTGALPGEHALDDRT